ncbi:MAG: hypothetical protein U5K37_01130 [Natrialbaceae archaeon]|nr:hypothetical protein [Natrialbaceae archaeon]
MYDTLSDDLPIRIGERGHRVPNVELKFPTDRYDRLSLEETVSVELPSGTIPIGSIELQIAYKLAMGAQKDFEDALYLYEVFEGSLNDRDLESYVTDLGVETAYDSLR